MADKWDVAFEQTQQDSWWMPEHVVRVDRPEIHYTYDPKGSKRYSSVTRVSPNLNGYADLVSEVVSFQRPTSESAFMIGAPSYSKGLESALLERTFRSRGVADCWSIDVNAPRPTLADDIVVRRVESEQGMRDMDAIIVASFERSSPTDDETMRRDLAGCTGPDARCRRYVAYDKTSGTPLSAGSFNVFPEQGLGFMWAGSTIAEARGRGAYSAVVTARMHDASGIGLQRIGLYALRTTSGPIVRKQGFQKHGRVDFWIKEFDGDSESS